MELIKFQKAQFDKNKLILDDSITLEVWKELGQALKQVEGSVQFWLGDWARHGEKMGFSGKYVSAAVYDELEEITGVERKTLQNYKSVAETTAAVRESSPRGEQLSFAHYREIASLPEDQQQQMIDRTLQEKFTTVELRNEIKALKKGTKVSKIPTVAQIREQEEWEDELRELAENINTAYNQEQRVFLINLINF